MADIFVSHGYDRFAEAASHIGPPIVLVAVVALLAAIGYLVLYAIRYGEPDEEEGKTVTDHRPIMPTFVSGLRFTKSISKRSVQLSRSGEITDDSLVDGTATLGQRIVVLCIITMFVCIFLLFLGLSLWALKDNPLAAIMPIPVGAWLLNFLRVVWRDHQKAKKRVAARRKRAASTKE